MDEYIKKIEEYIIYKEKMEYKKILGYPLSSLDMMKLDTLKEEAKLAEYYINAEYKRLKKLIKAIK